jgi:hypothetical protein
MGKLQQEGWYEEDLPSSVCPRTTVKLVMTDEQMLGVAVISRT